MKLEARKISFRYSEKEREIWKDFSLEIDSGERVGLSAPSGFGKTTLCKILAGYEKPESGVILLDGKPLSEYRGYCPVQMIWQHPEYAVNPRLRMEEVLRDGDQVEERVIRGLGIEDGWRKRFPAELSGGELQRFCIARALGRRTKFLLADEISTMLDLITQSQIWEFLIHETKERGIGLLCVSHSEGLLERVSTRRISLENTEQEAIPADM